MARLLLVYGYEPSGHSAAAKALESAARCAGHEARRVDISKDYHPILGPALAKTYLKVVQKSPGLWGALYDSPAVAEIVKEWRRLYLMVQGGKLRSTVRKLSPDAIVCTHAPPLGALGLEKKRRGLPGPLIAVMTDYRPHSYWAGSEADLYLVPTPEAARTLAERGVPRSRVSVTGIPIHPAFEQAFPRPEARRRLGLPDEGQVVLLSGGSRGIGQVPEMAEVLLKRLPAARLLVACGENVSLRRLLAGRSGRGRLSAFGPLGPEGMRDLLCASDLHVGKAGGLTVAESLAVGVPMLVFEPIPGQEEGNAEYLVRHGAGRIAKSLSELSSSAGSLHDGGLEPMRRKALALGRPDSARRGISEILSLLAS